MEDFKLKNDITVLDEQKLLLLRNQAELETARRDTASRLREGTARLENMTGSMSKVSRTVPLYSENTSTPAVEGAKARLLELELRRNELLAKYSPNSRVLVDVNNQISLVRKFLDTENSRGPSTQRIGSNPTYEGLSADAIRLRAEVDSLRARQSTLDAQVSALEKRRTSLEQLERQYRELALNRQILEQQYQAYAGKAEEARILDDMDRRQAANVRIVEKAVPPIDGRNLQPLIIALGIVAGLMTALVAALLREFTRTTLVTPEAVERALGLPVLAAVPFKRGDGPQSSCGADEVPLIHTPAHEQKPRQRTQELRPMVTLFDEMVRLFAVLNPPLNEGRGRILQFISAQPGEGVSTIAREFARVAARHSPENVLLLDLNTQSVGQYDFFKNQELRDQSVTVSEPVHLGFDPSSLWSIVSETEQHDLATLARGELMSLHRIGSTRLAVSRFNRDLLQKGQIAQVTNRPAFWDAVRETVNFTVVDLPASSRAVDGLAVSTAMDAVVLVVEAESTRVPVIEDLRDRLRARGAHVAGVVFNKRSFYIPEPIYRLL